MKITTFNPQIITKKAEPIAEFFEELGFERHHRKEKVGEICETAITMKNADGFKIDISQTDAVPVEAMVCIRMNVDDYDRACNILLSHGFKSFYGDKTADTPSSRSAVFFSPTGFAINLVKHIKK